MWIARKRMLVARDGVNVAVMPGSPVPEADKWNRRVWINQGFIEEAVDSMQVEIETELSALISASMAIPESRTNDLIVTL